MSKPVIVDFQFSIKQGGRGARKRIVESVAERDESKPSLERIPRISHYMALAIHFEDLIRRGIVTDYADIARLGHVTRARVTQIMNLRLLAPEIQEALIFRSDRATQVELKLLQKISSAHCWTQQSKLWQLIDS